MHRDELLWTVVQAMNQNKILKSALSERQKYVVSDIFQFALIKLRQGQLGHPSISSVVTMASVAQRAEELTSILSEGANLFV